MDIDDIHFSTDVFPLINNKTEFLDKLHSILSHRDRYKIDIKLPDNAEYELAGLASHVERAVFCMYDGIRPKLRPNPKNTLYKFTFIEIGRIGGEYYLVLRIHKERNKTWIKKMEGWIKTHLLHR